MADFSDIAIIYNPNSTGDAATNARQLQKELHASLPQVPVKLLPTEHAGHAVDLAYAFAKGQKRPLVVSASGDGGYNEVINGVLRAQAEGAHAMAAVLPSGNANDHARTVQEKPLGQLIHDGHSSHIDVLQATITGPDGNRTQRFAHSYIGLGLTPKVAIELNKEQLDTFKEAHIVIRTLWRLRAVPIRLDSRKLYVDSLICGNISGMAKLLTLSESAEPADGKFELSVFRHRGKLRLLLWLIKGVVHTLGDTRRVQGVAFTVLRQTSLQLDGELVQLAAGSEVSVAICPGLLQTVI